MSMVELLRRKPDLEEGFRWMLDWPCVTASSLDERAFGLYLSGEKKYCDLEQVSQARSPLLLLAFLRYDYKKTLIRTRYLYLDRLRNAGTQTIQGGDLDFAFFEPILMCFPNIEFIGRLKYSHEISWKPSRPNTTKMLKKTLAGIGGYRNYSEDLVKFHRHALSHELRPDGIWSYDLNTENLYGPPCTNGEQLYLNIPHFIDTCIMQVEKLCDELTCGDVDIVMSRFYEYVKIRFSNS